MWKRKKSFWMERKVILDGFWKDLIENVANTNEIITKTQRNEYLINYFGSSYS